MHPSFSGLLVTWANLPQTTLPVCVTRPSSETLTSITVPVIMEKEGDQGVKGKGGGEGKFK